MTKVEVGDKIWVTNAEPYDDFYYKDGDIFYVAKVWASGEGVDVNDGIELYTREFEVITGVQVVDKTANMTALVSEMESVLKRIKEALAND